MDHRSGNVFSLVLIVSLNLSSATGGAQNFLAAKHVNASNRTALRTSGGHERVSVESSTKSVEQKGFVNQIFTVGAPGTSLTPLPNMKRDDQCFQGTRVWTMKQFNDKSITCADWVTQLANKDEFWHARMETAALFDPSQDWSSVPNPQIFKCDSHSDTTLVTVNVSLPKPSTAPITNLPAANPPTLAPCGAPLHPPAMSYIPWTNNTTKTDMLEKYPESLMFEEMSDDDVAYNMKWEDAKEKLNDALKTWNTAAYLMVGCARAPSGLASVTKLQQPSYLLQNGNADCILTFKGTTIVNPGDVDADKDTAHTEFCGWKDVHRGFADHVRLMVSAKDGGSTSSTWKHGILKRLPKCKSLTVLGHSLGGAMAELFSYCANVESDFGLEGQSLKDWQAINWKQGTPERMPEYTGDDEAC